MSQREPTEPYVYQPDPAKSIEDKAWAVSGPGTEAYHGKRFAKVDAEQLVNLLKAQIEVKHLIDAEMGGGRRCDKCGGSMSHSRLFGWRCLRRCV